MFLRTTFLEFLSAACLLSRDPTILTDVCLIPSISSDCSWGTRGSLSLYLLVFSFLSLPSSSSLPSSYYPFYFVYIVCRKIQNKTENQSRRELILVSYYVVVMWNTLPFLDDWVIQLLEQTWVWELGSHNSMCTVGKKKYGVSIKQQGKVLFFSWVLGMVTVTSSWVLCICCSHWQWTQQG